MENISLTINGKKITCPEGQSILVAAENHGIKIPKLCHHHSLKPFGACRLCLVEDEKSGRIFASCVTPTSQDMVLLSDSPKVLTHRRNIISLMMAEHPESCVVCNKGNRCQLRMIAAELGIAENFLYPMPNHKPLEQANPFIMRDLSKCILCGKCIRADHELVCAGAIDYNNRGFTSRPATLHELPLEQSSCTFCGTCVSICPTGALSAQNEYVGTPERESNSICSFCGVGCNLVLGVADNKIVDVNPSHIKNSVNDATLCVRGHFAHDFLNSANRLTQPLIHRDKEHTTTSWDEAIQTAASRLMQIKNKYGSDSIAFIGSSKCTNEENYLFQKIARTLLGTNNIDNGGYLSGRLLLDLVEGRTDEAGRFNFFAGPLKGLEQAEVIFVLGADPAQTAPVVDYYLKRSVRNGVPLIVANPQKTSLAENASLWINPYASRDTKKSNLDAFYLELINAISVGLLKKEAADSSFISRFTHGYEDYVNSLESLNLAESIELANLTSKNIENSVEILAGRKITFVVGDGIMLSCHGKDAMEALLNLALMTGSFGYKGAGFHVLSKENNLVGAWHMGTVPNALPGRLMIANEEERRKWEKPWESELPTAPGSDLMDMIHKAEEGKLKAIYIMGENPIRNLPQPERLAKALKNIEFIVVQDILATESAKIADVILPGAAFSEKEGSFTNLEGMVQCFTPAVTPPGNAKTDLEILGLMAEEMGSPQSNKPLEDIRKEISETISFFSETDVCKHPIWIKEKSIEQEKMVGMQTNFSPVSTAKVFTDLEEYPFIAFFSSLRFHLGSGTRTAQSPRISRHIEQGEIGVSPSDADKLKLIENDRIRISSAAGTIEREICISADIQSGFIHIPNAYNENDARYLLQLEHLFHVSSNGWDSCRVMVEKVARIEKEQ